MKIWKTLVSSTFEGKSIRDAESGEVVFEPHDPQLADAQTEFVHEAFDLLMLPENVSKRVRLSIRLEIEERADG